MGKRPLQTIRRKFIKSKGLYLFLLPSLLYFIIFRYGPMYGAQIAFKDYSVSKGIFGSSWAGLKHFKIFFNSFFFWQILRNTLTLRFFTLLFGFPVPIVLALMLNEIKNKKFKKTVQTVTYAPYFISTIVMVSMIFQFLNPRFGIINKIIELFGGEPIRFMTQPGWFAIIYVSSGIWQTAGWASIIYLAALSGVDPQLHEAALMDGCNKLQRIWYVNIPWILPTILTLLILNIGIIMNMGFEKIFLMQNALNLEASEVIVTYVYKAGLIGGRFDFSTAIGLLNSVINCILLFTVNQISKVVNKRGLF